MKSINAISDAQDMTEGIAQALSWLADNRQQSPRLEREADRLSVELLRRHNRADVLAHAARQPAALGLFGLATAAKSWLIGTLAGCGEHGALTGTLGGQVLDYNSQLNLRQQPATLVLRFSRRPPAPDDMPLPVQLNLLSEWELAAVLALQFQQDNSDNVTHHTPADLTERLQALAVARQPQAIPGITRQQMVALWDSLNVSQRVPDAALASHFWPQAMELAPLLGVDERASLFSLLWRDEPQLTALYRQLAHVLHHFSGAGELMAPLSVLDDAAGSALNHSGVCRFNTPADPTLRVVPLHHGYPLPAVGVTLAELTLLSREVVLPLQRSPSAALPDEIDLLDYPCFSSQPQRPADSPPTLAAGFLQARCHWLVQRAAQQLETSHLLICSAAASRREAQQMGRLFDFWQQQWPGTDVRQAGGGRPGLIWAITPFNARTTAGEHHDAVVQRYLGSPGETWGTLLAMDEKGVQRMATYLAAALSDDGRSAQLAAARAALQRDLSDHLLGGWYRTAPADDSAARLCLAETLLQVLETRTGVLGELLERLLPTRATLRQLFLSQQQSGGARINCILYEPPFAMGTKIDLLNNAAPAIVPARQQQAFAGQVYRCWVNLLRQLPDNRALLSLLNITRATLALFTDELITASIRQRIDKALIDRLAESDRQGLPAEQRVDRQISAALGVLGDFVAWLGFQHLPEDRRPRSRLNPAQALFSRPTEAGVNTAAGERLTHLSLQPMHPAAAYIDDWLAGLKNLILHNAGYAAWREIHAAQRRRLAQTVALICQ